VARATAGLFFAGAYNKGIYRSSDSGNTWAPAGLGGKWVQRITIDDSQILWVNVYYSLSYRSTDLGKTWIPIDSISGDASFAPDHNGGVFAGQSHGPIFRTIDSGATWVKKSDGLPSFVYGTVMTVDAEGNVYAFPYHYGVFRSTNLGDTWTRVDRRLAWTDGFVAANTASGSLIVGTRNGGVFRSDNHGISWKQSSAGIGFPPVSSLFKSNAFLFASTTVGVFRSADNGRTWIQADTGFVPFSTSTITQDFDRNILAAAGYMFRSGDDGTSWSTTLPGSNTIYVAATANRTLIVVDRYLEHSNTPMYYYNQILRSTDNGANWTTVMDRSDQSFTSIFAPRDSLVFSSNMRSTNDGRTWEFVIRIDSAFNTILSDSTGRLIAGTSTGILHSADSGKSWNQVATLGASVHVLSRGDGSALFAGTDGKGVLASTDLGYSWTPLNTGLSDSSILSMVIAPDGHLVVGTWHGGVYRSVDRVTSIEPSDRSTTVTRYSLEQNYPNPFNPKTVVSSQLPVASQVRLVVYDLLGREVAVLVNERRSAGSYQDTFDGSGLASGVYFYQMTAGSFVEAKKLLLLR
jgi:photosystem II stability/assembly factor-like uncharacterized protein